MLYRLFDLFYHSCNVGIHIVMRSSIPQMRRCCYSLRKYWIIRDLLMSIDAELLFPYLKPKRAIDIVFLWFWDFDHPEYWDCLLQWDGLGLFKWFIDDWIGLLYKFNIMNLFDFRLHEEFILLIVHYFIYYIDRPSKKQSSNYLEYTELVKNQEHSTICMSFVRNPWILAQDSM